MFTASVLWLFTGQKNTAFKLKAVYIQIKIPDPIARAQHMGYGLDAEHNGIATLFRLFWR